MKITSGLNKQIFLALAVVGLFPLLVMAFQNHYFARQTIENVEKEQLAFSLRSRLLWLRTWVSHTRRDFYHLAFDDGDGGDLRADDAFILATQKLFKGHVTYDSLSLFRPDWSLFARYPTGLGDDVSSSAAGHRPELEATAGLFVVGTDYHNDVGEVILPVGQALLDRQGEVGAFLVAEINLDRSLRRILGDVSDLKSGGRYLLVSQEGRILYRSPAAGQGQPARECIDHMVPEQMLTMPPWQVRKMEDCRGEQIYAISAPVPEFNWTLVSQFNAGGGLRHFENYVFYGLFTAAFTLLVLIALAKKLSQRLAAPLDELTRVAHRISSGQHKERLPPFREEYVREVGVAFNAMMDALERQQHSMIQSATLSTVGKMSSSLVHEMRNPLSSIKINLQALARRVKEEERYAEIAAISLRQVRRLETMCDDLLQFSKPVEIHKEPITFAELAAEVVSAVHPVAVEQDVEIKVEDGLGDFVFLADRENSCRALINLVENAIQWSPPGQVVTLMGGRAGSTTGER